MAGRGATQTSQPTKLQKKKNKSKSKAKDYWVSVFFCVIPYDALKSYKKGKFQIGKKKFETELFPKARDRAEEAIRVVSGMPKWKPGVRNGIPMKVEYELPINFKIDYHGNVAG
jgi:hypothetical protein